MKQISYTKDEILSGCNREESELIKEIGDRIQYFCSDTNGDYVFPNEHPAVADILKMITRLCLKSKLKH